MPNARKYAAKPRQSSQTKRAVASTPARALTATGASLLGFLHEGAHSGWDLVAKAETTIGDFWNVTKSQVYRELESLAAAGLVELGATGARARQPYQITARGRAAFSEWISTQPGPLLMRWPLSLTVYFGKHVDEAKLSEFLATHRAQHAATIATLEQHRPAVRASPEHAHVAQVLELGLRFHRLVVAWIDGVQRDAALSHKRR